VVWFFAFGAGCATAGWMKAFKAGCAAGIREVRDGGVEDCLRVRGCYQPEDHVEAEKGWEKKLAEEDNDEFVGCRNGSERP